MFTGLKSALATMGIKSAVAIAGGGLLFLLGFLGLTLLLVSSRQRSEERGRYRRNLLIVGSALLVLLGGSAIVCVGIILPMQLITPTLKGRLDSIARIQSEQLALTILSQPKYRDPKQLNRYEFKMFSQNGEDGILAEIFRRIGTTNRHFVEFGASDGSENNTVFLLRQGWNGLWMDADSAAVRKARTDFRPEISGGRLTVIETFITAENIETLFHQGKVPEEIDLLSIDIDRNDYHVWNAIAHYRPRCVVIEYNAAFPPTMSWVVSYDPHGFGWNSFGNGNGASLKALVELGNKKGYRLVGCELCGVNAFFVREDLLKDRFAAPYTAENHYEPFRYYFLLDHRYERSTLGP